MATGGNVYSYGQTPIAQQNPVALPAVQGKPSWADQGRKPLGQALSQPSTGSGGKMSPEEFIAFRDGQSQTTPGGLHGQIGGSTGGIDHGQTRGGANSTANWGAPGGGAAAIFGQRPDIGTNQEYIDNAYAAALRQMEPQMDRQQRSIEQSLVSKGLTPGTAAYQQEMDRMSRSQNDMLQSAAYGAQQVGLGAQNQAYQQQYGYDQLANQLQQARIGAAATTGAAGAAASASRYGAELRHELGLAQLGEQGRQFDVSDIFRTQGQDQQFLLGLGNLYNQGAGMGINQFNAQNNANNMWYGQGSSMMNRAPGMGYGGGVDMTGNVMNAGQAQYNAAQQGQGNAMGLIGGALSMFSDMRLKENIKPVGTENGINMYEFEYKDKSHGTGRYRGVMAQEVRHDYPDAVITGTDGHLRVDYSQLPVDMTLLDEVEA